MDNKKRFSGVILALVLAVSAFALPANAADIEIIIYNADSFGNHIRVYDAVCDEVVWVGYLAEWGKQIVPVCESSAGYGRIEIMFTETGMVLEGQLLTNGQVVKI